MHLKTVLLTLVLLALGFAIGYVMPNRFAGLPERPSYQAAVPIAKATQLAETVPAGELYKLPSMIFSVPAGPESRRLTYVKAQVSLQPENMREESLNRLRELEPKMKDAADSIMLSIGHAALTAEGKELFRQALFDQLNRIASPLAIKAVYIEEFLRN